MKKRFTEEQIIGVIKDDVDLHHGHECVVGLVSKTLEKNIPLTALANAINDLTPFSIERNYLRNYSEIVLQVNIDANYDFAGDRQ